MVRVRSPEVQGVAGLDLRLASEIASTLERPRFA
jgi:hypothetical protein